jgi:adiponectin receptor
MCFFCAKRSLLSAAAAPSSSFTTNHAGMKNSKGLVGAGSSQLTAPPTFKITEIDEHLKWNPYIWSGYRENYTFGQCLYSFFTIHNESVNVWSHFAAVLVFAWAMHHTLFDVLLPSTSFLHLVIWATFFLTAIACFAGSAIYHLFFPQSVAAVYWLGILDFTGIAALVLGSYFPPVFYGFHCFPFWQRLYITSISLLGTVTLVAPWFRFFHSQRYLAIRVSLYAMVAVAGIVPAVHSYFLLQTIPHNYTDGSFDEVYHRLYIMYGLYTIGVLFYMSKFPESRFPGQFDIWFNSHQWWHLLVVCGTLVHWSNCLLIYDNYLKLLSFCPADGAPPLPW